MKNIYEEFRQFCRDSFSSPEIGEAVCNFYRKHIIFTSSQKVQHNKSLTKVRKAHVKGLLEEFNETSIINIINQFLEKLNKNEVVELNSVYFYTCVKNNYTTSTPKQEIKKPVKKIPLIKINNTPQVSTVIPIVIKQLTKTIKEDMAIEKQFLYQCPKCQTNIPGKQTQCQSCNSMLDYSAINYSEVKK